MVIGHGAGQVRQVLGDQAEYALQEPQLGTGHAVMQAESLLSGRSDLVLVLYADMPLLTADTLQQLVELAQSHADPISMLTVTAAETRGFGRILRDASGQVCAVVEEAQATPEQLNIHELNPGVYCFRSEWLWPALKRITLSPKGEYYLTDLVGMAVADGHAIHTLTIGDPRRSHRHQYPCSPGAGRITAQAAHQPTVDARRCDHDRPLQHLHRAGRHLGAGYRPVARHLP